MSKFGIINLIDKLFISIAIFLTIFAWINFYTRNLWLTFILSLIFSFACIFLLYYFLSKKKEKKLLTKKNIEDINKNFFNFRIMSHTTQMDFLKNMLKNKNSAIENGILSYTKNGKKTAIIIACNYSILTENDFLNIVQSTRNLDCSVVEIICSSSENFNTKILKDIEYVIIPKETFYKEFFIAYNTFPSNEDVVENTTKTKLIDVLNKLFLPHKAKSYFVCGLILIFSSIILPYHAYYVIFGSILMLFAIVCKIKKIISG